MKRPHRVETLHLEMAERWPAVSQVYLAMSSEEMRTRKKIAKQLKKLHSNGCHREEAYRTLADSALTGDIHGSAYSDEEMYILLPVLHLSMGTEWVKEWLWSWKNGSISARSDEAVRRLTDLGELEIDQTCPDCHGSGGGDMIEEKCWLCQGEGEVTW